MSSAQDLRDAWSTLSPRERDARVAEALGWFYVPHRHPPGESAGWHRPGTKRSAAACNLPDFSAWGFAGHLLDKLREEGWTCTIRAVADDANPRLEKHQIWQVNVIRRGGDVYARGKDGPSAIALAFCLSRDDAGHG